MMYDYIHMMLVMLNIEFVSVMHNRTWCFFIALFTYCNRLKPLAVLKLHVSNIVYFK